MKDRPYIDIGVRIYRLRTERGMSQRALAEALGGAGNTMVCKWECGHVLPSTKSLMSMSRLFGVTVDYILFGGKE